MSDHEQTPTTPPPADPSPVSPVSDPPPVIIQPTLPPPDASLMDMEYRGLSEAQLRRMEARIKRT
jgi:hypothetical protein